jgi:lysophospholipase L1-like esterase
MYNHIPEKNRLPVFPNLDTFKERASDNLHPHKKHYELFVNNIKPYIDKKTT